MWPGFYQVVKSRTLKLNNMSNYKICCTKKKDSVSETFISKNGVKVSKVYKIH